MPRVSTRAGSGYPMQAPAHVEDYIIKLLEFPQEFQQDRNIRRLLYSSVLCRSVILDLKCGH